MRTVGQVLWGVVVYEMRKRQEGLPALVGRFERAPRPGHALDVARALRLTRGVLRRIYRTDYCFPQSLILFGMLTEAGREVRLVTGVRREAESLAGHAWVECAGAPLGEPSDPTTLYAVTYSYPSSPDTG